MAKEAENKRDFSVVGRKRNCKKKKMENIVKYLGRVN